MQFRNLSYLRVVEACEMALPEDKHDSYCLFAQVFHKLNYLLTICPYN